MERVLVLGVIIGCLDSKLILAWLIGFFVMKHARMVLGIAIVLPDNFELLI